MLRKFVTAAAVLFVLCAPAGPAAQEVRRGAQLPPTFRAEVNHIEVDVTVTDDRGNFVRHLTAADFEVLEDGKRQDVSTFDFIELPHDVRPPNAPMAATRVASDVRSNTEVADARVFVLVLDDLHTHPLRSRHVKNAARQFTERYVGASDLVSIVYTSGRTEASQEFTSNPRLLSSAIDKFVGRKVRSALLERLDAYNRQSDRETQADLRLQHVFDPLEAERARQAEQLLTTLERLGDLLANARGRRKSVVLISEGIDYDIHNAVRQTSSGLSTFTSSYAQSVIDGFRQAIGAMTRANVAVYGIDPRGLATTGDDMIEVESFPENPLLGLTASAFADELRRAQDSVRVLSEETGGFASVSSNDFSGAFDQIVRQNSTYYVLGYRSSNAKTDGRFRQIDVRVKRPGLRVRARKGYLAPSSRAGGRGAATEPSTAADVLRQAVTNPLPTPGVPIRAFAAPFKGTRFDASVVFGLELDARSFKFRQENGLYTGTVEAAVVAVDSNGSIHDGDRHSVTLRLKPDTYEVVRAKGLRLMFRQNLAPGRYQLRAAAHDTGSAAVGSVHYDIEVPDFMQTPLSMSGIVLTSTSATAIPTPQTDPELQSLLRAAPVGAREFTPADILTALFAVYDSSQKRLGAVDVAITVASEDGELRFNNAVQISEDDLRQSPNGYACIVDVPLAALAPGTYVLRVHATSRLAEGVVAARELTFKVPPHTGAVR